jgi:copper chaperone CopZ
LDCQDVSAVVFIRADDYMGAMTEFAITGMTCNGCRTKVEKTLAAILPDVKVTLDPPRAMTSATILAAQLNAILEPIGKYRASSVDVETSAPVSGWLATYYPLLLVMALIAVVPLATGTFMGWMMGFMAGFYIVFGAFKLLDVPAFAASYAQYDIIARHVPAWGYAYPFIELALGFGFLFWLDMRLLSWAALILSVIGAIGVIQANAKKQTIQCACLGTVFKLPMSVVTVVENLGMAAMAAWMLLM